jgi:hypothetical protein
VTTVTLGHHKVSDDSGFLALVDPDAYQGSVGPGWDFSQLLEQFRRQMAEQRLLIWATGMENTWSVEVRTRDAPQRGFRDITGPIRCTRGRLLLTSYDSLTMAAQFPDVSLPEPHEREQIIHMDPGMYRCRIVQRHDPDDKNVRDGSDFVLELQRADDAGPAWTDIPWRHD